MASAKTPYTFKQLHDDIARLPQEKGLKDLTEQLEQAYNKGNKEKLKITAAELQSRNDVKTKLDQQALQMLNNIATHGTSNPEKREGKSSFHPVTVQPRGSDRSQNPDVSGVDGKTEKFSANSLMNKTYIVHGPTPSSSEPSQSKVVQGMNNSQPRPPTMPADNGKKSTQKRKAPSPQPSMNKAPDGAQATPPPQSPVGESDKNYAQEIIKTKFQAKRVDGILDHAKLAAPGNTGTNAEETDKSSDRPPTPELSEKQREMETLEAENEDFAQRITDLTNRLQEEQKSKEQIENTYRQRLEGLLKEQEKHELEKTLYREALEKTEKDKEEQMVALGANAKQISELNATIEWYNGRLETAYQTIKNLKEGHDKEMKTLKEECDDLKTRFSKLAGEKLHQNNPDIADLSDADRAVKLAERFSCLYDDEWTDAFQEQTETLKYPARDAIQNLLETLLSSYKFCHEVAQEQLKSIDNCLTHPCSRSSGSASKSTAVVTEVPPEQENSVAVGTDDRAKPKDQATPGASTKDVSDGNEPIADSAEPLDNQSGSSKETSQPKSKKSGKKSKKDKNGQDKSQEDNRKGPEGKDANGKVKTTSPAAKDQTELEKCVIKLRRERRDQTSEDVQQAFVMKMKYETTGPKTLKDHEPYWRKCADLCWRMIIQDPPLWLDTSAQPGTKVSLEMYRCYAATGDVVEYLVWPPMHIQGGGLVAKGVFQPVVQPKSKKGKR